MSKLKTELEWQKDTLLKDGPYTSTKDIVIRVAKYMPDNKILAELDKKKNIVYHTAKDILNDVVAVGEGLIDLGLEGKHVAICADNCYSYVICDIAISSGVGVVTPIDVNAQNDLLVTLLNRCDADAIICSHHIVSKLEELLPEIPKLKTIITIEKKVGEHPYLKDVMEKGKKLAEKGYYLNKELDLDATAKILFTSGTTGANKGVVLSQKNLAANTMNCFGIKGENVNNTSMSVLPMHHATEINTHIFTRMAAGRLTYINDSMKNMMTNIAIFKPFVITIVPMIANAFYKAIWTNAKKAGKEEMLKKGIKLIKLLKKFGVDISHKLLKDVYAPFGGNLKQIVCGGAMLNPEVVKGFADLGVHITNGYGITECGPLVSMNTETQTEPYSIGTPAKNLEIKVADLNEDNVGELCVKGESVSK
ncbi:MAG: AMP-binding protein [Clostridia bacterium]|nr:AMP-binding protein [Clostridia bacterium]